MEVTDDESTTMQNMTGIFSGLQARIKKKREFVNFMSCAANPLELVAHHDIECVQETTVF